MKRKILILAFIFWGLGCFLIGYSIRGFIEWYQDYNYDVKPYKYNYSRDVQKI